MSSTYDILLSFDRDLCPMYVMQVFNTCHKVTEKTIKLLYLKKNLKTFRSDINFNVCFIRLCIYWKLPSTVKLNKIRRKVTHYFIIKVLFKAVKDVIPDTHNRWIWEHANIKSDIHNIFQSMKWSCIDMKQSIKHTYPPCECFLHKWKRPCIGLNFYSKLYSSLANFDMQL